MTAEGTNAHMAGGNNKTTNNNNKHHIKARTYLTLSELVVIRQRGRYQNQAKLRNVQYINNTTKKKTYFGTKCSIK